MCFSICKLIDVTEIIMSNGIVTVKVNKPMACRSFFRTRRECLMYPNSKLRLVDVSKTFSTVNGGFTALSSLSMDVSPGRFVSLIGPSGCGKSTLFNIIAGLETPSTGRIEIDGENLTGLIGRVGYMLQKDLLLPWRTVIDNIVLGMEIQGMSRKDARDKARPYLKRYGLGDFETQFPSALSGGMRQRAALLRTLLLDNDVILLDEPFGALDAQTKAQMQEWLLNIWEDFGKTVVFVTHDIEESIYLSDEICVMGTRPGRLIERISVPMARPRPRSVVTQTSFVELKQRCMDLLNEPHHEPPRVAAE